MLLRDMFPDLFGASATSTLLLGQAEGNVAWHLARKFQVSSCTVGSRHPQRDYLTSRKGQSPENLPWALRKQPRNRIPLKTPCELD